MPGTSRRRTSRRRLSQRPGAPGKPRIWQIAFGALAGNLVLHQLTALPDRIVLLSLIVIALVAVRCRPVPAAALFAFSLTGLAADSALSARWPADADGQDVELAGWIDSLPQIEPGRTVFSLRVIVSPVDSAPRRVRLSWYDDAPVLAAGQAIAVEARIRSPRGLINPGGFDYERWLLVEGYDATGYVRERRTAPSLPWSLARTWLRVRARVAENIAHLVAGPDAAVLIRALALGERSGFGDRHWEVLQRSGTSHLVAVSGLHIGMIAAMAFWLLLRLALRLPARLALHAHSLAAFLSLLPAGVYAALAGFTLPTRRALIMLVVVQLLVILGRRAASAHSLCLALIVILAADPLASLTASFWLSFVAVAVLLAASMEMRTPLVNSGSRPFLKPIEFCRLQYALTLGLMPLVIWFFGQVSLASFAVNLVAIPVFGLVVVPLSLVVALTAAFGGDPLGVVFLAGTVVDIVWQALAQVGSSRFAAIELPRPDLPAFWLGLAAIALTIPRHGLPGRRLGVLALLPLFLNRGPTPGYGQAQVTVLDVGHGLAVAIDTATHRVLYDAGPLLRSGFDAGGEIVVPALEALGGRPPDLLILSHGDSDHAGGAASVVGRYPDVRVMTPADVGLDSEPCEAGMSWHYDGVRFSVLHPPTRSFFSGNDGSCVVHVETLGGSLLLTGDIETRAEARLAGSSQLAADVVVVPHHGSSTSSTTAFVRSVEPSVAIVSAAHNNRWGFPRPEVTDRWTGVGAVVLTTADLGAIELTFGAGEIEVDALRHSRRRYWQATPGRLSGDFDPSAL